MHQKNLVLEHLDNFHKTLREADKTVPQIPKFDKCARPGCKDNTTPICLGCYEKLPRLIRKRFDKAWAAPGIGMDYINVVFEMQAMWAKQDEAVKVSDPSCKTEEG